MPWFAFPALPLALVTLYKSRRAFVRDQRLTGVVVLIVQVCFLLFNLQEGVNIAGSRQHSESAIRYIWILFAPDALFLVYYGLYRKSSLFGINLTIYLTSNAMRGWLGTWVIILFIEGAYRLRNRNLNWRRLILIALVFILLLPVLIELKWTIRTLGVGGVLNFGEVFLSLLQFAVDMDWWAAFSDSALPIVMRFQHLANVIGIMDVSTELSKGLAGGEFQYFFEEGLPQYTIKKIFEIDILPDIHNVLLTYLVPEQLPIDTITNTHVGLVGWFWISPSLVPLYLFYLVFLSWSGVWLAKKAGGSGLLMDVIWFAWLGYLMNGWFAAYIEFMQALVVLLLIRALVEKVAPRLHANASRISLK